MNNDLARLSARIRESLEELDVLLQRIFELVAEVIDGVKPAGENWHQVLLKQMSDKIPDVRPAVISENTIGKLNEYRGFRHVVTECLYLQVRSKQDR